jgi:hypothetical protein
VVLDSHWRDLPIATLPKRKVYTVDTFRELYNASLRDRGGGVMYEVARFTIKVHGVYRRHEQRRPHDSSGLPTGPSRECDLELFRVEDMPIDLASRRVIVFCRCLEGQMEGQGFTCSQAFFANNFRPVDNPPVSAPVQRCVPSMREKVAGYAETGSGA